MHASLSCFLDALPADPALRIQPHDLIVALKLRLGCGADSPAAGTRCRCGLSFSSDHAFICNRFAKSRTERHDRVVRCLAEAAWDAGCRVVLEPTLPLRLADPPEPLRRADLLVILDESHPRVYVDVSVTHPVCQHVDGSRAPGLAAAWTVRDKIGNAPLDPSANAIFVPFVCESFGFLHASASRFLRDLAGVAERLRGAAFQRFYRIWLQRLSVCLVRANVAIISEAVNKVLRRPDVSTESVAASAAFPSRLV